MAKAGFDLKDLIPLPEAGRLLGVSRVTVWRWVKAGNLEAVQIGERFYVRKSHVEKAAARR